MADISKITTPDGTTYDLKDATARAKDTYPTYLSPNAVASGGLYDIARFVQGENMDTVEVGSSDSLLALKGYSTQTRPTYNGSDLALLSDVSSGTQNTWYGTCATAAATQAKVVTTTSGNFTLATGNMVRVKFTNAQTYNGGIKLNVDNTGAVNVMRQGTTVTVRYFFLAGEVVDFVYDGTNFIAVNEGIATTTYYGVTKLSSSTSSTSTSLAATPSAVKSAYDLADSKSIVSVTQTLSSGTEIGSVTVDGVSTPLYAPSGGGSAEALTDAEIEAAVTTGLLGASKTVTITLTDPSSPSAFESCTIYELLSYEGGIPSLGSQVGSISSPTGSTEVEIDGSVYGLMVSCSGGLVAGGYSTCTGDVISIDDRNGIFVYEVNGDGAVEITQIDWDD